MWSIIHASPPSRLLVSESFPIRSHHARYSCICGDEHREKKSSPFESAYTQSRQGLSRSTLLSGVQSVTAGSLTRPCQRVLSTETPTAGNHCLWLPTRRATTG